VIIGRYIQRSILMGTLGALLLLVCLSLFFLFVRELDDIGDGSYGLLQAVQYVLLSAPGELVEFVPLAVLLGSMLSLGAMAANSEIIAMQASGMSLGRLLASVMQAAALLAVVSFLIGDLVVPDTETAARHYKSLTQRASTALQSGKGLWLKDESRVVHIGDLLPNGYARDIEIFELDATGKIVASLRAASAIPVDDGWELQQVSKSAIYPLPPNSQYFERLLYEGRLSQDLLQVLMIKPRKMSSRDLLAYLEFLDTNRLDSSAERLILWRKFFAPMTIFIMCLLVIPFVLGSQRQASSGQRLLVGILLGLAFVVADRLLTQLGSQVGIAPLVVALLPNLLFLLLAVYLLTRKLSHGVGGSFGTRAGARRDVDDTGTA
jgi:lipopolysaccharide export system permease protein